MNQALVKNKTMKWLWAVLGAVLISTFFIFLPSIKNDVVFSQQRKLSVGEYRQQALAAEAKKDLAQAIWNFRQALELDKDDKVALAHLPNLYLMTGQLKQALEYAEKRVQADPQASAGYFFLGMAYQMLGQNDKARESFHKAVEMEPKYADAFFNLGFLSESDGHLTEAIEYYKEALDADPKHAKAAYNLGNAYAGLERNEDAIGAYKIAVANDPNYMDAFVNLSILLTQAEDYQGAIKYLDEARILGYDAPEAYLKSLEQYRLNIK